MTDKEPNTGSWIVFTIMAINSAVVIFSASVFLTPAPVFTSGQDLMTAVEAGATIKIGWFIIATLGAGFSARLVGPWWKVTLILFGILNVGFAAAKVFEVINGQDNVPKHCMAKHSSEFSKVQKCIKELTAKNKAE